MNLISRIVLSMVKRVFPGLFLLILIAPQFSAAMGVIKSAVFEYGDNFALTLKFDDTVNVDNYDPKIMSRDGSTIIINVSSAVREIILNTPLISSGATPLSPEWGKPEYIDNILLQYDTLTGEISIKKIHLIFRGATRAAANSSFVEVTSDDMVIGYLFKNQIPSQILTTKLLTKSEFNTAESIVVETVVAVQG